MTQPAADLSRWRLVPVEATEEMFRKFYLVNDYWPILEASTSQFFLEKAQVGWRAMVDASPPPPVDVQALVERNAKLEEGLRPFADLARDFCCADRPVDEVVTHAVALAGDLDRARALLSEAP